MANNQQLPEGTDQIIDTDETGDELDALDQASDEAPGAGATLDDEDDLADIADDIAAEAEEAGDGAVDDDSSSAAPEPGAASVGGPAGWADRVEEWKAQGGDRVREFAQVGLDRANGAVDDVVRMINEAADQIDDRVGAQYGDYARRAAQGIGDFGGYFKDKDADALFADARELVRKSPAVAIGAAAALGFVVARLARAGLPEGATPPAGKPDRNKAA